MQHLDTHTLLLAVGAVLASYVAGLVLRKGLFLYLRRLSARTDNVYDDIIIDRAGAYISFFAALAGAYAAVYILPLNVGPQALALKVIVAIGMGAATLMVAGIVHGVIEAYTTHARVDLPHSSLTQNIIRGVIIAVGGLVILSHFGVAITPLLTALGVGSLAVALALQDTLSNLLAGFHIIASKQVRAGEYVKLESGQEGEVVDVGWRNTRIRQLANNIVIVPNSKISSSIVVNCSQPDREIGFVVPVGVAYGSDLERVETIAIEVATEVQRTVAGGVPSFVPAVRYTALADSSINFNMVLRGRTFTDQPLLTHEFIKRIAARFEKEGIEIPFPQRVVHLKNTDTARK